MNQLIVYTKSYTERQAYVFDFILNEILGLEYLLTDSSTSFENSPLFKINYSDESLTSDIQIIPCSLLFENEIISQEISISEWNKLPVFFQTSGQEIPFDLFGAVFYLITRYEEYLPYTPDLYLRFPYTDSLAYKNNFLQIPLVDLWLKEFRKTLQAKNSAFAFKENAFKFLPTYDIDIAYSYTGKGIARNLGGALNDLIKGNIASVSKRKKVLQNTQKDPYDSYGFLDALHEKYGLHPVYFFLAGENGRFDKNIPFEHETMQKLFADISSKYATGIHPSWQSHEHIDVLRREVAKISTGKSRQHYIRFTLPGTYQQLISLGITEDYSMGYGSINGFRASTAFPFDWFDVSQNKKTSLRIFPFCYMECNSFFEQGYTPVQAYNEMEHYLHEVRNVNGTLITIWHNFSLGTDPLWDGWKEAYENFLKLV